MNRIDENLMELKAIKTQQEALTTREAELRKEVFGFIEYNGLVDGYKNEYATVSYVERKSVKIADREAILKQLQEAGYDQYIQEVPAVAAHLEISPDFEKDLKKGVLGDKFDGLVEVETSNSLALRFK